MKKLGVILLVVFVLITASSLVSASCDLDLNLVAQDPAFAVPGEYVKLVFQLEGISNSECGEVGVEFIEEFPFSLDIGEKTKLDINSGHYISSFPEFMSAPFKVITNKNAVEGNNTLRIKYFSDSANLIKEFNISVEEVRTDFNINIKQYDSEKKELTLEILNIGEKDADALTLEIPSGGANYDIYGTSQKIVGDVSAKDDELMTFIGDFNEGFIPLKLEYSDQISERRTLEKEVYFDERAFSKKVQDSKAISSTTTFFIGIILTLLVIYAWKYYKRRKLRNKLMKKYKH